MVVYAAMMTVMVVMVSTSSPHGNNTSNGSEMLAEGCW